MTLHMRMEPIPEPDSREDELPRWAQDQLERCRRIARESQAVALEARLATKPDESGAVLDFYGEVPVGLGERPEVTFKLYKPKGWTRWQWISVRANSQDSECLEIRGSKRISIEPQVTNVIRVRLAAR